MKIELIYDVGCPNIPNARDMLTKAISHLRLDTQWVEWDRAASDSPSYVQQYGSPTILVDGQDVVPQGSSGNSCRIYRDSNGTMIKAPPFENLLQALETSVSK